MRGGPGFFRALRPDPFTRPFRLPLPASNPHPRTRNRPSSDLHAAQISHKENLCDYFFPKSNFVRNYFCTFRMQRTHRTASHASRGGVGRTTLSSPETGQEKADGMTTRSEKSPRRRRLPGMQGCEPLPAGGEIIRLSPRSGFQHLIPLFKELKSRLPFPKEPPSRRSRRRPDSIPARAAARQTAVGKEKGRCSHGTAHFD